jgi:hypothetical protein
VSVPKLTVSKVLLQSEDSEQCIIAIKKEINALLEKILVLEQIDTSVLYQLYVGYGTLN